MSTYMVDRKHIIYLVKAATSRRLASYVGGSISWFHNGNRFQLSCMDEEGAVKAAQMLWNANLKSIHARYPDTVDNPENMPGPISENWIIEADDFRKFVFMDFDIAQIAKAIHCLEYQSCEYDKWPESEACAFLAALKEKCLRALVGYTDAEWGAPN